VVQSPQVEGTKNGTDQSPAGRDFGNGSPFFSLLFHPRDPPAETNANQRKSCGNTLL
jgi:hypothetical protein